jgi:transcriptional regulator with XRE-family HTH domain
LARIGLKLFFLRTREREQSQQQVADALGIRQATLSHIEQGRSLPACELLLTLARFYDVTPTFLLDDGRGVLPLPSERWRNRNALATTGMWVEAPRDRIVSTRDGKALCPLLPGEAFYDDDAAQLRAGERGVAGVQQEVASAQAARHALEQELVRALQGELRAHPQRRRRGR